MNWLLLDGQPLGAQMGSVLQQVQTFSDEESTPIYHVVSLSPSGYIVVSADDLVEPIIAFSPEGIYEASPSNPLYALVTSDLAGRMAGVRVELESSEATLYSISMTAKDKWELLLSDSPRQPLAGLTSISDPRVDPFVLSKWSQDGDRCCGSATYDYYTPPGPDGNSSNYPSGCVATAMAQLMRYWQYPTAGIGVRSFSIAICGSSTTRTTRGGNGSGGSYDWASMDLDPCCPSLTTRQAIGALCYDSGLSVNMNYCSGGSGADTLNAANALKSTFGYSQARRGYSSGQDISAEPRNRMINPNLHAGFPVILGITGAAGGHAIICDGYGYNSSTMYHHLNMGWAGSQNAWYNLPNIDSSIPFNSVYKCVYNVFTTGTGEIIAGRVTDNSGNPIAGATVTGGGINCTTNARGIYALPRVASNSSCT